MRQFVKVPAGLFNQVMQFMGQQPINQCGTLHSGLMNCEVIEEEEPKSDSPEENGKSESKPPAPPAAAPKTVADAIKK